MHNAEAARLTMADAGRMLRRRVRGEDLNFAWSSQMMVGSDVWELRWIAADLLEMDKARWRPHHHRHPNVTARRELARRSLVTERLANSRVTPMH